jgi:hypothetical protein
MRIRWTDLLLAAAIAVAVPGAAVAEDEALRREMDEMRNMILQLQDTVQAQSGQIEQQREVIDRAGIEDVTLGDGSASGISSFFQDVEINGWLTFTYFINTNDVDNDELPGGFSNIGIPFAGADDNSFTFQQLWLEVGKPATKESRAGFFSEIAFGRDASTLRGGFVVGGGDNVYLNSAYIEYLASFGEYDVTFKAGKFGTLIGYEVAQAPYNFNITRGNVYNLLQPITHVGILASTDLPAGFDITLGVVNNPNYAPLGTGGLTPHADGNDNKTFIGHLGYTADTWSVSLNGLVGGTNAANEEPNYGIIDLIIEATPIDKLTLVLNADLVLGDNDSNEFPSGTGVLDEDDPNAWGVALTANYDWTERLATAVRYEFVDDDGNVFACSRAAALVEDECQIHSLTTTVSYALTDDLKVRGEMRFDDADIKGFTDQSVYNDSAGPMTDEKQVLFGVEAIYEF